MKFSSQNSWNPIWHPLWLLVAASLPLGHLLRGRKIRGSNEVWASDITYIRLRGGFVYLVAVMDWYRRYVLSWRLSNTLDTSFCLEALEEFLEHGTPEIFNTDQGSQFISLDFTGRLLAKEIEISMDGRGRYFGNIFVERLWRSVKYEEVYLKDYTDMREASEGLGAYFKLYNQERLHQALGYRTPWQVYKNRSNKARIQEVHPIHLNLE